MHTYTQCGTVPKANVALTFLAVEIFVVENFDPAKYLWLFVITHVDQNLIVSNKISPTKSFHFDLSTPASALFRGRPSSSVIGNQSNNSTHFLCAKKKVFAGWLTHLRLPTIIKKIWPWSSGVSLRRFVVSDSRVQFTKTSTSSDNQRTTCAMSAQQGAPDFATQMATFTQQLTALQSKVATLWAANATLQANKLTLTTQINALGGQPPNIQAAGGTGATATTVATPV